MNADCGVAEANGTNVCHGSMSVVGFAAKNGHRLDGSKRSLSTLRARSSLKG